MIDETGLPGMIVTADDYAVPSKPVPCPACGSDRWLPADQGWQVCTDCHTLWVAGAPGEPTETSVESDGTVNVTGCSTDMYTAIRAAADKAGHGDTVTVTMRLRDRNTLGRAISLHRAGSLPGGILPTETGIRASAFRAGLRFVRRTGSTLEFRKQ